MRTLSVSSIALGKFMEWHIEAWTKNSRYRDRALVGQTIAAAAAEAVDLHGFEEIIKKALKAAPPQGAGPDYLPRLKMFLIVLQASIKEGGQTIRADLRFPPEYYEND